MPRCPVHLKNRKDTPNFQSLQDPIRAGFWAFRSSIPDLRYIPTHQEALAGSPQPNLCRLVQPVPGSGYKVFSTRRLIPEFYGYSRGRIRCRGRARSWAPRQSSVNAVPWGWNIRALDDGRPLRISRSTAIRHFDQKAAEHKTPYFFLEKQGLAQVNHCISLVAGMTLIFTLTPLAQPLLTSQPASVNIWSLICG
jgi:hypothetical protein